MAVFKGNVTIGTFIERGAKVEQVNNTITQDASTDQSQHPTQVNAVMVEKEDESGIVDEIKHIFPEGEDKARMFVEMITGKEPLSVTEIVNEWVQKGMIFSTSRKGELWEVLNRHGYYTRQLATWNKQVK